MDRSDAQVSHCNVVAHNIITTCTANICRLEPDPGPCNQSIPRFYFDPEQGMCRKLTYGGCGGNDNNFVRRAQCLWACNPPLSDVCKMPPLIGNCKGSVKRFFFDHKTGQCKSFRYSGCGGNANLFGSMRECRFRCYPWLTPDVCSLPVDFGVCPEGEVSSPASMWYYDADSAVCTEFQFNGCNGNGNRFKTERECAEKCTVGTLQW
ncbi:hypothetical protein CAPTEDRAFT_175625 [Capitella teleta]|uniref:BPTI/Kunitz inhibitor domain-containing protein n=1 Tax=Capitella teleta TaxID=283909 RepID=R7TIJ1_CAPTE|nr:hypothetical protein CAPTEDRAFT_175625 [Capitella teleta]|eukprot:ELT91341.1 hypothetical protein CAPTEDRAFT_175625 [Capitella teleta]